MYNSGPPPTKITRGHSCVPCQRRKVRCDGNRPCAACVKSGGECTSARSLKALRRRDAGAGATADRLLARIRRCEELLQVQGVNVEDDGVAGDVDNARQASSTATASKTADGQMIVEHGHSRYIERYSFPFLGQSFPIILNRKPDCVVAICGKELLTRYSLLHSLCRLFLPRNPGLLLVTSLIVPAQEPG
jgi:Fungal Zn(2)-Cys(6) binuclear cluster domain